MMLLKTQFLGSIILNDFNTFSDEAQQTTEQLVTRLTAVQGNVSQIQVTFWKR